MKKFYVTGMIRVVEQNKINEAVRYNDSGFDRIVYADNAEAAKEMVCDSVRERRTKKNRVFRCLGHEFPSVEVFEKVDI